MRSPREGGCRIFFAIRCGEPSRCYPDTERRGYFSRAKHVAAPVFCWQDSVGRGCSLTSAADAIAVGSGERDAANAGFRSHMNDPSRRQGFREALRAAGISLGMALLTLAALEVMLRVADFRMLREGTTERSLSYRYDPELGWAAAANSDSIASNVRTLHVHHNSPGLRDSEFNLDGRPTMLFLGDSFVWGLDAEANERFTELLEPRVAGYKILSAGVSGYGTDQEFLLLKRLWAKIQPAVVALIFCTQNDRLDNSTNIRYEGYQKPYFEIAADGSLVLRNVPVPQSRLQYIREDWWVRNLWLGRLVTASYVGVRYPLVTVPDPTERLVSKMRQFVEANGAKFLVGLQYRDEQLIRHLEASKIPFVSFDGADFYAGE